MDRYDPYTDKFIKESSEDTRRYLITDLTQQERQGKLTWTTAEIKQYIADAFEQLPPEQLGTDCIGRRAAIDVLDAYQVKIENGEENPYAWARLRMSELPPAQPEPCEDAVKSHSEKDVLNMCISLLDEMVGYFSEYMEWIGYEPTEEEKECGYFGMTYFHIVQKLFLYHTTHSGGTSTFKKCHELGIDDPSDGVRFPLWKEEEGDAE